MYVVATRGGCSFWLDGPFETWKEATKYKQYLVKDLVKERKKEETEGKVTGQSRYFFVTEVARPNADVLKGINSGSRHAGSEKSCQSRQR